MKKDTPDTIAVTPTPPEAQVTDTKDSSGRRQVTEYSDAIQATGPRVVTVTDVTNVNPGPIPDGLREGDTAAPDAVMSFAALGSRLMQLEHQRDAAMAEVERLTGLLQGANGAIVSYQADIAKYESMSAQIAAAEADGNAVIYVAPDCVPWLKATVHEAKHGYTTQQQYAAAVSIEAQCDAITGA